MVLQLLGTLLWQNRCQEIHNCLCEQIRLYFGDRYIEEEYWVKLFYYHNNLTVR